MTDISTKTPFKPLPIWFNHIRTPDGTILVSRTRHDCQTYIDDNGEEYMVDGGYSYLRRNLNQEPYEELSYDFESSREHFKWGVLQGKKDDRQYIYVPVKELSCSHLENIARDGLKNPILHRERVFRKENNITIPDGGY